MPSNPALDLFTAWFQQAQMLEPLYEAACLSTVDAGGRAHARMVLVKEPFVFYTNLSSPKVVHIRHNPHVALCFFWKSLAKQVRVEGPVEKVDDQRADAYFATRPRVSQLNAWASRQSEPMLGEGDLEAEMVRMQARFEDCDVPRPSWWSGYWVEPLKLEFWEEGVGRCHKRLVFERKNRHDEWISYSVFP